MRRRLFFFFWSTTTLTHHIITVASPGLGENTTPGLFAMLRNWFYIQQLTHLNEEFKVEELLEVR